MLQGSIGTSQPFLFTGEPYDDETNLLYLRSRYDDPAIGRFLQRDRMGGLLAAPLSLNRYIYVSNNPASLTDPSGYTG